ncbi:MAG: ATP-binding cassette domain-containing protein [Candidatus Thorarchaeota archaeon]|nr:ATP-binding cassette domain-containing protein [Candidatus Thorarchaeota archaeon]
MLGLMASVDEVVVVQDLVRLYGDVRAVDGISFTVRHGEVFGLPGPNCGGETTAVRMLTGVIAPTSRTLSILGMDMPRQATATRRHIGVLPATANVYAD